jgi:GntR family transcriptional regulator, galactonate operon transcriptional repressor
VNQRTQAANPTVDDEAPSRLHQRLMRRLLADIANDKYAAGERLPPEMELARQLEVSRGVIRELLRSLDDRGIIAIRHGRGAWVNPTSEWNVLDAEVLAALMPTPASVGVLTHYLECRRILETEAAALAAERASSADLSRMADALAQMSELAVPSQSDPGANRLFHAADIAFHGAIFRASGNQVLPRVVEPIQRAMATLRPQLALHPEHRLRKTLPEHKAILAAIADHDADRARAAMSAHLATIENYLREYRMQVNAAPRVPG